MQFRAVKNSSFFKKYRQKSNSELITIIRDRVAKYQVTPKLDSLPDLNISLKDFNYNIDRMVKLSQERNFKLVLLTQPVFWKAKMDSLELSLVGVMPEIINGQAYATKALEDGMELFNDIVRKVKADNVFVIDLAAKLPKDTTTFYDHCHFNISGAKQVQEVIYPYLEKIIIQSETTYDIRK